MNPDAPVMFIGRWQPFHEGHKALIEVVLKRGQDVVIAVRNTPISKKNPYTYFQRYRIIQEAMEEWGERVQIVEIPDISGVAHGRDVGWTVEHIELSPELEAISGTKIREAMK